MLKMFIRFLLSRWPVFVRANPPRLRLLVWFALFAWAVPHVGLSAALSLPAGFSDSTVGSGWDEAVGITFASDGRMFVWERAGKIWIVDNGVKAGTPFLDISSEVGGWRDFGLLGFCLHPDFYNNGHVYLFYVVDHHHAKYFGTPNYNASTDEYYQATIGRITRYRARSSDGFRSVDPSSRKVLMGESITNGSAILHESHGVGTILFGTDGTLIASCGDGASYSSTDLGSASETYYAQGLSEGIIRPNENVGAYRAQMVGSFNGKILRLDPDTGEGIPSNPFFDSAAPRAPRSLVWALGFRNPCRMTLRPGTGSHNRADANPGSLYVGDVGWRTWEELSVCTGPGQNFGWPAFEGLEATPYYNNSNLPNRDTPNPLYGINGCIQQFFYFRDLIKQDTLGTPSWPNQCNTSQQVPATIPHFLNRRPALDWKHDSGPARTGIYSGNNAAVINVGAAGSPVSGSTFAGNCSIGGIWYTNTAFPELYRNTYFHADYGEGWIKNFTFDTNDRPVAVRDFLGGGGGVVFVTVDPKTGDLFYISWTTSIHRVHYSAGNQPPIAVAAVDQNYGPAPLAVQFTGTDSFDPEDQPLTFSWDFGDGTAGSSAANPMHTFNAPAGVPTPYTVTLVVTDSGGFRATNSLLISVNNTPPQIIITSPVDGTRYPLNGDTIYDCTATLNDAEHAGSQLTCAWQTFLHHNDHEHSEPIDGDCITTTTISGVGCNGETYYYRIVLTVKDPSGLSTSREVRLYPDCARQVPVITWNDPAPIFQGTPLGSAELNATANTAGTFVYLPRSGTILPLGNAQALTVSFTPTDTNAYTSATRSVLIDVLSRPFPVVTLTTPTNGAFFHSPATIPLAATVTSNGWFINSVEFFSNDSSLGEDSSPPYDLTWNNVADGAYTLTARALYDDGSSAITPAPVNITVASAPPFSGVKINFQPAAAPVPTGYFADSGAVFGDRGNGFFYGWNQDNSGNMTDRNSPNSPDQRYDTFAATQAAGGGSIWEIALPTGIYSVFLVAGDPARMNSTYRYDVENLLSLSGTPTAQNRWISASNVVSISAGRLTVSNGNGADNNKLCFIDIAPIGPRIQWVGRNGADTITLRLEGTAGRNCEIQASDDLLGWQPVATVQNTDGLVTFTDSGAGVHSQRFYRAKLAP